MTPDQTTQLRVVLDALKKIQAERTQGDWLHDEPYIRHRVDEWTSPAIAVLRGLVTPGIGDARAIVASVNLLAGQIDLVEGLLNAIERCVYCDRSGEIYEVDWTGGEYPHACSGCELPRGLLTAYLTRATAVLEGLRVNL